MSESKSTGNYVLNLLIIGIAIVLVIIAQQSIGNYSRNDPFVGKVPMVLSEMVCKCPIIFLEHSPLANL